MMTLPLNDKSLSPRPSRKCTMTNESSTLESSHEVALKSVLDLPISERTDEQCWQVALFNVPLAKRLADRATRSEPTRFYDFVHEALIGLYTSARTYKPPYIRGTARRYLYIAAQHSIDAALAKDDVIPVQIDARRKYKDRFHKKRIGLTCVDVEAVSTDTLLDDDEKAHVYDTVGKLPDRERNVIMSRYYRNQSCRAIGKEIDLTEQSVGAIRRRAIQRLKSWLTIGDTNGRTATDHSHRQQWRSQGNRQQW